MVFMKVKPVSDMNWAVGSSLVKTMEPTLKPYQPNHSRPAPIMVRVRLCGRIGSLLKPMRLPMISASTPPAIPALMCTTVPPA